MDVGVNGFLVLLAAVGVLRGVELVISQRHRRTLRERGAHEPQDPSFVWMALLHAAILIGAALEVVILHRPLVPWLAMVMATMFVLANIVRWWAIRTLGLHWNVRVVDSAHLGVVTSGPFRFVRHPNYAAVFVELWALPLIHTAWITAIVGSVAHLWVLSKRIGIEETVLHDDPTYGSAMAHKPRFVPSLLGTKSKVIALIGSVVVLLASQRLYGEPVPVRHTEGIVHGFLVLRTLEGKAIADGDLIQTARGSRVTVRLVFRFKDGSLQDETAVFSQRQQFRLLSDHLIQKGPTFPRPLDLSVDVASGDVTVRYTDNHGEEKTESEHLDLPADLANGLILTLLKNVRPGSPPKSVSLIAATPKPRVVKLAISAAGRERFSTGGAGRTATHYVLKVEIGGLSGVIAPLIGKQPPDSHVWILGGEAPAFVKSEQPFYLGGPVWRIELVSPVWPQTPKDR
jgi:isoprenylcysteine carboxyl methyltransferase (ICMT) family protein YpbQ